MQYDHNCSYFFIIIIIITITDHCKADINLDIGDIIVASPT